MSQEWKLKKRNIVVAILLTPLIIWLVQEDVIGRRSTINEPFPEVEAHHAPEEGAMHVEAWLAHQAGYNLEFQGRLEVKANGLGEQETWFNEAVNLDEYPDRVWVLAFPFDSPCGSYQVKAFFWKSEKSAWTASDEVRVGCP